MCSKLSKKSSALNCADSRVSNSSSSGTSSPLIQQPNHNIIEVNNDDELLVNGFNDLNNHNSYHYVNGTNGTSTDIHSR
jgi:hypothetical protein